MSVWELYTQLFARNWIRGRFARSLSQGCSEKIRKKDVIMIAGRWSAWSIQIPQFLMLWWPAMKAGSTAMTQRPRHRVSNGSMLALPDPRRSDRENPPTNFRWSVFFDSTGVIYMHWVPTGQAVNKEYDVEVLREYRERIRRKRPALYKSGQWRFYQDNAPVHNSILLTDYFDQDGHQDRSSASLQFRPCSQWLLVIPSAQRLLLWDNWGDERGCDEGHWHAHTKGLPWGLPEVVWTVQQAHCSRRRLLVLWIKVPIRKKSGNLFNETCIS